MLTKLLTCSLYHSQVGFLIGRTGRPDGNRERSFADDCTLYITSQHSTSFRWSKADRPSKKSRWPLDLFGHGFTKLSRNDTTQGCFLLSFDNGGSTSNMHKFDVIAILQASKVSVTSTSVPIFYSVAVDTSPSSCFPRLSSAIFNCVWRW